MLLLSFVVVAGVSRARIKAPKRVLLLLLLLLHVHVNAVQTISHQANNSSNKNNNNSSSTSSAVLCFVIIYQFSLHNKDKITIILTTLMVY